MPGIYALPATIWDATEFRQVVSRAFPAKIQTIQEQETFKSWDNCCSCQPLKFSTCRLKITDIDIIFDIFTQRLWCNLELSTYLAPRYTDETHNRMLEVYLAGLALSWNLESQSVHAKKYLQFASYHQFDPLAPEQYDLLTYTLHTPQRILCITRDHNELPEWREDIGTPQWGINRKLWLLPLTLMKKGVLRPPGHIRHQTLPTSPTSIWAIVHLQHGLM